MDPGVAAALDRKVVKVAATSEYTPIATAKVLGSLEGFFAVQRPKATVEGVSRAGGGASKEQFFFSLVEDGVSSRHVLRMDPIQTASETDRRREFEALQVIQGVVPAPVAEWLDHEGKFFRQPAAMMAFVEGVTKPTAESDGPNVTGIGTTFGPRLKELLAPQYLDALGRTHNFDWRTADLPSFDVPDADPYQAARWQVNWWSRVWRDDAVQVMPVAAMTERWLRNNLPPCDGPVLVHGDYRTGNFLFDEETGKITAILDWEFAHLGDFHEDLGWMLQALYASHVNGDTWVCDLYPKDRFVAGYEEASGRAVNLETLRWYEILCAYKCLAITLATSTRAARDGHNHQDVLLSWMAPVGYRFVTELCDLMGSEVGA